MKVFEPLVDVPDKPVDVANMVADLRRLAEDMEALLTATADQTGRHVAAVRAKAHESLLTAKARIGDLQHTALAKSRAAGRATNRYVHANAWQIMAISTAAGLVIGTLVTRVGRRTHETAETEQDREPASPQR